MLIMVGKCETSVNWPLVSVEVGSCHLLSWTRLQSLESDRECANVSAFSERVHAESRAKQSGAGMSGIKRMQKENASRKGWTKKMQTPSITTTTERPVSNSMLHSRSPSEKLGWKYFYRSCTHFFFSVWKREECVYQMTCFSLGGVFDGQVRVKQHVGSRNDYRGVNQISAVHFS